MKKFYFFVAIVALVLTGCVASNNSSVNKVEDKFKVVSVKVGAFSQVDETFIREMVSNKIVGNNGEYLVFLFELTDKTGAPIAGIPVVWRTKGDNNTQVQKTDADGLVSFWEPVGALSNSLPTRKSKWGPMEKDMVVKATVNPVGEKNNKAVVKIQLYK